MSFSVSAQGTKKWKLIATPFLCPVLIFLFQPWSAHAQQSPMIGTVTCEFSESRVDLPSSAGKELKQTPPTPLLEGFDKVRFQSFPELNNKVVKTRTFQSSSDYFRTRISISRFLLFRPMHYFVEMNLRITVSGPTPKSVCAILAHELVHLVGMSHGNRIRLLGMVRMLSSSYTAKYERATDLEAIRRGYGEGLSSYREWVYQHVPPAAVKQKRRNYFSPDEISAILQLSRADPALFSYWKKHVPLNLREIQGSPATVRKIQNN